MADDGLSRAVSPSHTIADGDTVFSLATATWQGQADITTIGALAADALSEGHRPRRCSSHILWRSSVGARPGQRSSEVSVISVMQNAEFRMQTPFATFSVERRHCLLSAF